MGNQTENAPTLAGSNREHLGWLLEGVDKWNTRRDRSDFKPDLAGFDISGESRKRDELPEEASVDLRYVNLSRAALEGATLTRCLLDRLNFRSAALIGADLSGSRIVDSDMLEAKLTGSFWLGAKCYRTRFSGSALRNASLFEVRDHNAPSKYDRNLDRITNLSEFVEIVAYVEKILENKKIDHSGLYYRGHRDESWKLDPSVIRLDLAWNAEAGMLTDLMSSNPDTFSNVDSLLSRLILAREYGLPTRLLDVTSNPLVALYFASLETDGGADGEVHIFAPPAQMVKSFNSDSVSVICAFARLEHMDQIALIGAHGVNEMFLERMQKSTPHVEYRWEDAMDRLMTEIGRDPRYFSNRIEPIDFYKVFLVKPRYDMERLREQHGAFLISAFHRRFERDQVMESTPNVPLYHHFSLTVPSNAKKEIRMHLRRLGVNRETLFPGFQDSVKQITERYRN